MSAGSCFAARIATFIKACGVQYLQEDDRISADGQAVREESPSLFSLRYGNIYTVRHLLQLLQRASGALHVEPPVAVDKQGRFRNLSRPAVLSYADVRTLRADDQAHLANIIRMLGAADVFIFTLGLTEHWVDTSCDLVLPTTPGCGYGDFDPARHQFRNSSLGEVTGELGQCFALLAQINPRLKIILTLSPVPLVATYRSMSAIEATFYSKSLLRQAIAEAIGAWAGTNVAYFPSYEIVTNPHVIAQNFEADMRSISAAGVGRVMSHFQTRLMDGRGSPFLHAETAPPPTLKIGISSPQPAEAQFATDPVCDEENIWRAYLGKKGQ